MADQLENPHAPEIPGFVETATLVKPRPEEGTKDHTMVLNMGPQHPSTHMVSRACSVANEGLRMWTRYGLAVPSLTA